MLQIIQHQKTGQICVDDLPAPKLRSGSVIVRNLFSLISVGTERTSVETARSSMLQKARSRPDLVRQLLDNYHREGLVATYKKVRARLDNYKELGYSCAGVVLESMLDEFKVGDRVACGGVGYAAHAEIVSVPRNLAVKVPDGVGLDEAAFTTICAIALQGVRQAELHVGEKVAVIGLGLIGLIAVQLLKASGCRVIGIDISPRNFELALTLGCDRCVISEANAIREVDTFTRGYGSDAVIITAATTSNQPVEIAIQCCRKRGTVVVVGAVGMDIPRSPFYEKEINFRISCSYGPGRYDPNYEDRGQDYPLGFVRWTENRNMDAVLDMLAQHKLNVSALITHRIPVEQSLRAYDLITGKSHEKFLGVIFNYPEDLRATQKPERANANSSAQPLPAAGAVTVGLMGTGAFASAILLPAIRQERDTELVAACSATGVHSRQAAEKFRFGYCTTDESELLRDSNINTLVIATRHNLHAAQVLAAMATGRHIFCEKPLCLKEEELADIVRAHGESGQKSHLLVGFNRRFAPMVQQLKTFVNAIQEPLAMQYRVNAGYIPPDHWLNDPEVGGGRLLGEVCHFIDLLNFVAGSLPVEVETRDLASGERYSGDNVIVSLRFANGSHGSISYFANGDKSFSKERIEVFGGGSVAVLEDFRRLEFVRNGRRQVVRSRLRQDKGHRAEWAAFAHSIRSGQPSPVPFNDIVASTLATLRALESRSSGAAESVDVAAFLDRHGALGAHS